MFKLINGSAVSGRKFQKKTADVATGMPSENRTLRIGKVLTRARIGQLLIVE